jgi:hypothetical protein
LPDHNDLLSDDDEVWVLLVRHTTDNDQSSEFMSLNVAKTFKRVHSEDVIASAVREPISLLVQQLTDSQSVMTNSLHTLARRLLFGLTSTEVAK